MTRWALRLRFFAKAQNDMEKNGVKEVMSVYNNIYPCHFDRSGEIFAEGNGRVVW
jgi:hypothetical protein